MPLICTSLLLEVCKIYRMADHHQTINTSYATITNLESVDKYRTVPVVEHIFAVFNNANSGAVVRVIYFIILTTAPYILPFL